MHLTTAVTPSKAIARVFELDPMVEFAMRKAQFCLDGLVDLVTIHVLNVAFGLELVVASVKLFLEQLFDSESDPIDGLGFLERLHSLAGERGHSGYGVNRPEPTPTGPHSREIINPS